MNSLVYLDNCSFNRPFDDQLQPLIKLETEAKLLIQMEVLAGNVDLVWSFILDYENTKNPFHDKRLQIALWEAKATVVIAPNPDILLYAESIMQLGIKKKDALHVSCAIAAKADYFITTDKKLLNKNVNDIILINPMEFAGRHFYVN